MIDRSPPFSIEAEQAVIGSLLIDRDAIVEVADFLKPEDFYRQAHSLIYKVILDLWNSASPPDIVLVAERLEAEGNLELIGGRSYLSSVTNETPTSIYVGSYAQVVHRKAILRAMLSAAGQIANVAYEDPENIDDAVNRVQEIAYAIGESRNREGYSPIRPLLHQALDTLEHLYEHKGDTTGIPTGFRDLDNMTQGLQPSDLIIVAARPSVGKTSLALNIAQHASIDAKSKVGVFSLEMSKEQLILRMLSSTANVDSQRMRSGFMDQEDFSRLVPALGYLDQAQLFIDDTSTLSIGDLRTRARRMQMEVGLDLLIIDYLQLMHSPGRKDGNRVQEVSDISRGLKGLARELRVPVVALSQLSRAPEGRDNSEPRLSDLRESGAIEQDADLVLFLWRPKRLDDDFQDPDGEIINAKLAKHRNGPIGEFALWFKRSQTKFFTVDTEQH